MQVWVGKGDNVQGTANPLRKDEVHSKGSAATVHCNRRSDTRNQKPGLKPQSRRPNAADERQEGEGLVVEASPAESGT